MVYDLNGAPLDLSEPLNVRQYGLVGDGTTDNLAAFNTLVAAHPGEKLYFPKGVYAFSGKLALDLCYIELDNAELLCTAATKLDRFVEVRGRMVPPETPQSGMYLMGNGIVNADGKADDAIAVARQKCTRIDGITIKNFQRYGILGKFEDASLGQNLSYELNVSNCLIETSLDYADAVAIYDTGDSTYTDTIILNVKTALSCSGSGVFRNIHAWCYDFDNTSADSRKARMLGTVFANIRENGPRFSDCYCDTYQKGFVLAGTSTVAFISNLMWFINAQTWSDDYPSYVFCANASGAAEYKVTGAYLRWRQGTKFSDTDLSGQTGCKWLAIKSDVSGTPSTVQ